MENDFILLKRIRDILFFIFCTCLMLFLSLFIYIEVNAETIDMPTPNSSLEIYRNGTQISNSSLPSVSWGGVSGKNVGGVNILNYANNVINPLQEMHIYYDNINSSNTILDFYFVINYNFDSTTYNPYRLSSFYVETANYVYTECSVITYGWVDVYNIKYEVICQVNKPLTSWNLVPYFDFFTEDYPFISNNDRARFMISTGSYGTLLKDATNQDVVNSITNQTNQIIQNNNNNTQQIVSKIDTTHGILRTISSAITNVINAIANLPSLIWNGFSSAFTTLFGWLSDIFDGIQDILSDDSPTSEWLSNYINNFPGINDNLIAQIITLPIHILTKLLGVNTCSPVILGNLYGTTLTLPCLGTTISNILGSLINIVGWMVAFYIYYLTFVKIKDLLFEMLTLEGNVARKMKIKF